MVRSASLAAFLAVVCLLIVVCPLLAGCQRQAEQPPVLVLAAASTKEAVEEAAAAYQKTHGEKVTVSVGASNTLARQIIEGAPADLFLSASPQWSRELQRQGLARQTRSLWGNRLVIAVPRDNPAQVRRPSDLLSEKVSRLALAGEQVPAGEYGQQALQKLGLLDKLAASGKIVRGHDVRATLSYIERGEAEAGIVYASDVLAAQSVRPRGAAAAGGAPPAKVEIACTFDESLHARIVYDAVLLKGGDQGPGGERFFRFLATAPARRIFERHGFIPLNR